MPGFLVDDGGGLWRWVAPVRCSTVRSGPSGVVGSRVEEMLSTRVCRALGREE